MENEFTEFINQNWSDKYKVSVTSSSPSHLNVGGALNSSASNQTVLQQYHQQTLRAINPSPSNYENIRLAFIQHRHQSTNAGQIQNAATNVPQTIQRNSLSVASCPKLINIHSMKSQTDTTVPYDCQSKYPIVVFVIFTFVTQ